MRARDTKRFQERCRRLAPQAPLREPRRRTAPLRPWPSACASLRRRRCCPRNVPPLWVRVPVIRIRSGNLARRLNRRSHRGRLFFAVVVFALGNRNRFSMGGHQGVVPGAGVALVVALALVVLALAAADPVGEEGRRPVRARGAATGAAVFLVLGGSHGCGSGVGSGRGRAMAGAPVPEGAYSDGARGSGQPQRTSPRAAIAWDAAWAPRWLSRLSSTAATPL